jgi:hypothetical protein
MATHASKTIEVKASHLALICHPAETTARSLRPPDNPSDT